MTGDELRGFRREMGLSQSALAVLLDTSRRTICREERRGVGRISGWLENGMRFLLLQREMARIRAAIGGDDA